MSTLKMKVYDRCALVREFYTQIDRGDQAYAVV
ncbi:YaeP family protein [Vibrio ostreicida]|nr:YaeP family protein [Vibrio ostreicida]NPD09885.1 hypothetical protein [Vibrio ostreicida]